MAPSLRHPRRAGRAERVTVTGRPRRKVIPTRLPARKRLHRHPELSSAQHRTPCYGSLPKDRAGDRRTPYRRVGARLSKGPSRSRPPGRVPGQFNMRLSGLHIYASQACSEKHASAADRAFRMVGCHDQAVAAGARQTRATLCSRQMSRSVCSRAGRRNQQRAGRDPRVAAEALCADGNVAHSFAADRA